MNKQEEWYDGLEPGIRDVVRLLRDNGFNTTCSCEHNMEIQLADIQHASDAERLAILLVETGYKGFVIRVHIEVPPGGYWARSMAVKLSWPFGGACFDPAPPAKDER